MFDKTARVGLIEFIQKVHGWCLSRFKKKWRRKKMRFVFNEQKAAQSAAFLLRLADGRMQYKKLIKLMYLSDKESLLVRGFPISGDDFYALPQGMVDSKTYNLVQRNCGDTPTRTWDIYVRRDNYDSVLAPQAPGNLDEITDFEKEILKRQFNEHQHRDGHQIGRMMHDKKFCPEWVDPDGASIEISPEDVLRSARKSNEEIQEIEQLAAERIDINRFF